MKGVAVGRGRGIKKALWLFLLLRMAYRPIFYITTPPFGHPFLKRRGIFETALVVRKTELISNRKFDKRS
jgi:hypothetical protein